MTVAELIKKLSCCNQNATVIAVDGTLGEYVVSAVVQKPIGGKEVGIFFGGEYKPQ